MQLLEEQRLTDGGAALTEQDLRIRVVQRPSILRVLPGTELILQV